LIVLLHGGLSVYSCDHLFLWLCSESSCWGRSYYMPNVTSFGLYGLFWIQKWSEMVTGEQYLVQPKFCLVVW